MATAGRTLGVVELFLLAAGAAGLVLAAVVTVFGRRVRVQGHRQLRPPRIHAGSESRVELSLRNAGGWTTPVCMVREAFADGNRQVRLLLGPVLPGQTGHATYRLPAERRGIYPVGPLQVVRTDPFGLATRTTVVAGATELTVYPRIDAITALAPTGGRDMRTGANRAAVLSPAGEDFYGLRAYEVGDDLRRVHWPSTARLDELMIRQHEVPRQGRVAVLLDLRPAALSSEWVETAVSAAATVVVACWRAGLLVRLITTEGFDAGYGAGHAHLELMMEELAVVEPVAEDGLDAALGRLRADPAPAGLVAVVGTAASAGDVEAVVRSGRGPGATTLVAVGDEHPAGRGRSGGAALPPAVTVVAVGPRSPFASAWEQALAPARRFPAAPQTLGTS